MEPNSLTRPRIVAATVDLLNEAGLDALSLRKVADRLGVRAPSLYWYVEDKPALLSLVAETVFRDCLARLPETDSWQAWLRAFGMALWRAQQSLRDSARLIMAAGLHEATMADLTRQLAEQLGRHGVAPDEATVLQSSVQALVTGWSGFAQSAGADTLAATLPIEAMVERGLDALIAGFAARR
ncbi:MAG: hypothetical protein RIS94_3492 [Pseudomonadota bacterium]|jgi:TetR/AcrR family tetracycline transcriptional repressor